MSLICMSDADLWIVADVVDFISIGFIDRKETDQEHVIKADNVLVVHIDINDEN